MGLIIDSFDLSYPVYDALSNEYLAVHEYRSSDWLKFIETENCRPLSFLKPPKGSQPSVRASQAFIWPKFIFDDEESLIAFMLKWG